jgi:hypothetical protein
VTDPMFPKTPETVAEAQAVIDADRDRMARGEPQTTEQLAALLAAFQRLAPIRAVKADRGIRSDPPLVQTRARAGQGSQGGRSK